MSRGGINMNMPTLERTKLILLICAAFSVMLVMIGIIGYSATAPIREELVRVKNTANSAISEKDYYYHHKLLFDQIMQDEKAFGEAKAEAERDRKQLREDITEANKKFKSDMNNLIYEINRRSKSPNISSVGKK